MTDVRYQQGKNYILDELVRIVNDNSDIFNSKRIDTGERRGAILLLRKVCEKIGDNDWPDNLDLRDIIDKHLLSHLEKKKVRRKAEPKSKEFSKYEESVFNFWKYIFQSVRSKISDKYAQLINDRIKEGYSETDIVKAIVGLRLSKYHYDNSFTHISYAIGDSKKLERMLLILEKSGFEKDRTVKYIYTKFLALLETTDINTVIKNKVNEINFDDQKKVNPKTGASLK